MKEPVFYRLLEPEEYSGWRSWRTLEDDLVAHQNNGNGEPVRLRKSRELTELWRERARLCSALRLASDDSEFLKASAVVDESYKLLEGEVKARTEKLEAQCEEMWKELCEAKHQAANAKYQMGLLKDELRILREEKEHRRKPPFEPEVRKLLHDVREAEKKEAKIFSSKITPHPRRRPGCIAIEMATPNEKELREAFGEEWEERMKGLDDRMKAIVYMRFGLEKPLTLHEVGDKFGIGIERVRQLQNIAVSIIRYAMKEEGIHIEGKTCPPSIQT